MEQGGEDTLEFDVSYTQQTGRHSTPSRTIDRKLADTQQLLELKVRIETYAALHFFGFWDLVLVLIFYLDIQKPAIITSHYVTCMHIGKFVVQELCPITK